MSSLSGTLTLLNLAQFYRGLSQWSIPDVAPGAARAYRQRYREDAQRHSLKPHWPSYARPQEAPLAPPSCLAQRHAAAARGPHSSAEWHGLFADKSPSTEYPALTPQDLPPHSQPRSDISGIRRASQD